MDSLRLAIVAIAIACSPQPARADTTPDPATLEQAHAHFKQGKAFLDAGVYDKAIEEFEAAYKQSPFPELLFNVGQAYRLANQPDKAIHAYQEYLSSTPSGPLSDEARTHVAELTKVLEQASVTDAAQTAERARRAAVAAQVDVQRRVAYDAEVHRHAALAARRRNGYIVAAIGGVALAGGLVVTIANADSPGGVLLGVGIVVAGGGTLIGGGVLAQSGADRRPLQPPPQPSNTPVRGVSWSFHF